MFSFLFRKNNKEETQQITTTVEKPEPEYLCHKLEECLPCSCGSHNINVVYRIEYDLFRTDFLNHYIQNYKCEDCGYTLDAHDTAVNEDYHALLWDFDRLHSLMPATCLCGNKISLELRRIYKHNYNSVYHVMHSYCCSCNLGAFYAKAANDVLDYWNKQKEGCQDVEFTLKGEKVVTKKVYLDKLVDCFKSGSSDPVPILLNGKLVTIRLTSLYMLEETNNIIVIK